MPEPQADALIDQLRRANRRWKALAIVAIVLAVAVAGLVAFTALQAGREKAAAEVFRAEAERAQQETKQALADAAKAKSHADQVLYAGHLQRAMQAWDAQDTRRAQDLLEGVPEPRRWEWHHLSRRAALPKE